MTTLGPDIALLTDEQLAQADRFVRNLYAAAEMEHFDASSRRRTKCSCGDTWPCPHKASRRAGIRLVEAVITELVAWRKLAQPPIDSATRQLREENDRLKAALGLRDNATERLRLARQAIINDGYFTEDQVGPDIAPRITELIAHYRRQLGEPETEWGHQIVSDDGYRGDEVGQVDRESADAAVRYLNGQLPPMSRAVLVQREVRFHATPWREAADE